MNLDSLQKKIEVHLQKIEKNEKKKIESFIFGATAGCLIFSLVLLIMK